jgi:hypothetical protein
MLQTNPLCNCTISPPTSSIKTPSPQPQAEKKIKEVGGACVLTA